MGDCVFCGKSAGFLKKSHAECKQRHQQGESEIISKVEHAASTAGDLKLLDSLLGDVASKSYIDQNAIRPLVVSGWERAVELAFDDGVLSEEEEGNLNNLKKHFSLSQDDLDRHGAFSKLVKGAVLRDVLNGELPNRINVDGRLPFNLQKAEQLVWVFQGVDYYEQKTRTQYVGGSRGVSVRIAKGVYYRTGGFKGERVQTAQTVHADTGLLGLTDKHIYFAGSVKRFRVPYKKIVAFEPFSDGIGIQKDTQSAKPQTFSTGDGWFTYNLVTNLAQM